MIYKNKIITKYPTVVFGTSSLGNLYIKLDDQVKQQIVSEAVSASSGLTMFDTAGKYGAGLALEALGKSLNNLCVHPSKILISNKLGWFRTKLETDEPTFEPGVWKRLTHDAVQRISYQGILDCFNQGNELLGEYNAQIVSVHDPDEYLSKVKSNEDYEIRYHQILDAYAALHELKKAGKVLSVGIGAKDWRVIKKISNDIELDWVMIANSLTIYSHPQELIDFVAQLSARGVHVINSAVFNGGFLTGGEFYNYAPVDPQSPEGSSLLDWRTTFFRICKDYNVSPAAVCTVFGLNYPGVGSIALSSSRPERVKSNITMIETKIPTVFWEAMQEEGLIKDYLR
ncbi:D-threo-aldose 1-dehydrogenase [Pedobacter sp. CAN_A7]|uniref:aldo/keto reductase n=1 Tax=Pedobacter sp. CAN_A7 TaxID=2787722 RepID=UPI0018C8FF8D